MATTEKTTLQLANQVRKTLKSAQFYMGGRYVFQQTKWNWKLNDFDHLLVCDKGTHFASEVENAAMQVTHADFPDFIDYIVQIIDDHHKSHVFHELKFEFGADNKQFATLEWWGEKPDKHIYGPDAFGLDAQARVFDNKEEITGGAPAKWKKVEMFGKDGLVAERGFDYTLDFRKRLEITEEDSETIEALRKQAEKDLWGEYKKDLVKVRKYCMQIHNIQADRRVKSLFVYGKDEKSPTGVRLLTTFSQEASYRMACKQHRIKPETVAAPYAR